MSNDPPIEFILKDAQMFGHVNVSNECSVAL